MEMTNKNNNAAPKTITVRALDLVCPECGARRGRPCKGSRIPSANSFGGGWGGPSDRTRPHNARYAARKELIAKREAKAAEASVPTYHGISVDAWARMGQLFS